MTGYPERFPAQAVDRVEAAITAAERHFAERNGDFRAVAAFVVDVADAFLTEFGNLLEGADSWRPNEVRVATGRFIDDLIDESYRDKFNPVIRRATPLVPGDISYVDLKAPADRHHFGTSLRAEIYRLPAWARYLNTLQEGPAESVAQADDPSTPSTVLPGTETGGTSERVFKRLKNGRWSLAFAGRTVSGVEHVKGLELIRRLLASPHEAVPALELMGVERPAADSRGSAGANAISAGIPALDGRTTRDVRAKLTELQNAIEIADDVGDASRAEGLRREQAVLEDYRRQGTALGGRPRLLVSDLDRARKAASRRCQTALRNIDRALPELAIHLRASIRQGHAFTYAPDGPVEWDTSRA